MHTFWSSIESVPNLCTFGPYWRAMMRDDYHLLAPWLRPINRKTSSFPNLSDPSRLPYRVVDHGPDDVVGVDPDGGENVTLSRDDLISYKVDRSKMHECVANALGLAFQDEPVEGLSDTWRMGCFCPFAGYAFPAFLTFPLEADDLRQAIDALAARCDQPFLLLVPTRRRVRSTHESLLKARKALILALSDALIYEEPVGWTIAPRAKETLDGFRATVIPESVLQDGTTFFPTPAGATWADVQMQFVDGETISARVGAVSLNCMYGEMGMMDRRNGKPTMQWDMLRKFAREGGLLTWSARSAERKNQKRTENLNRDLKAFFRIDGEPIVYDPSIGGWRAVFAIKSDA